MSNNYFKPPIEFSQNAWISDMEQYRSVYNKSIQDPVQFWEKIADRVSWMKKWDTVREFDFVNGEIKWFDGGELNVSYNCLDRHVEAGYGNQTAIIWEGNDPEEDKKYSYSELLLQVKKFANVLKGIGVQKGDRVCLYMQMIPELPIAMLACTRIGAVHSIVFGAFSSKNVLSKFPKKQNLN